MYLLHKIKQGIVSNELRPVYKGSIINVGVTPLRRPFQHYFFAKKISIQGSHTLQ